MGLGDRIESALAAVGVTQDRVKTWLGPECGCEERKAKLNAIDAWARRVLRGRVESAVEFLNRILETE